MLTDAEIADLLSSRKRLPSNARALLRPVRNTKRWRRPRATMKVVDDEGRKFWIEVTVASLTVRTRFTILVWYMPTGKPKVLLLKLNRHPSGHTNRIERRNHTEPSKIDRNVPHIHCLTERYQVEAPGNVDVQLGYAEPTDRFDTIDEAVEFLIYEFGFYVADDPYDTAHPLFKDLEP